MVSPPSLPMRAGKMRSVKAPRGPAEPFLCPRRGKRGKPPAMAREDGRTPEDHRPIDVTPGFQRNAEGSVLYRAGNTVVLCTASVDPGVPAWMLGQGRGWLTGEYQMHPRAS